jgi:HSP20 family protein
MNLVRQDPWGLLRRFQNELDRLYDADSLAREGDGSRVVTSHWAPAVDIKEEGEQYVIRADIPGVESKDIDITMHDGNLVIRGERREERRDEGSGYKRTERAMGVFHRRFALPDTADSERIEASYKDGVLSVVIPKQRQARPRKIAVA